MKSQPLALESFIPYRLSYTTNLVSEIIADAYKEIFGLSIPEWRVIAHVAERDGITQQEIGRRASMDKVTVSRVATALAKRGLIGRKENLADKRCLLLVLTGSGEALYNAVAPKARELEANLLEDFEETDRITLVSLLSQIDDAARAILARKSVSQKRRKKPSDPH